MATLAERLKTDGFDVIFDKSHLRPGMHMPSFMTSRIRAASAVLVICTDEYVQKADSPRGGVGWEGMIITDEIMKDLLTDKFIPIFKGKKVLPNWLVGRFGIDFGNGIPDDSYLEIVSTLRDRGLDASSQSEALEETVRASEAETQYHSAHSALRTQDRIKWRRLCTEAKKAYAESLSAWRQDVDRDFPHSKEARFESFGLGVDCAAPLIAMDIAFLEAPVSGFNHSSFLTDIRRPQDWNEYGSTLTGRFPFSVIFIYQALYGAACLSTGEISRAFELARTPIKIPGERYEERIFLSQTLNGWPPYLESHGYGIESFHYLMSMYDRWAWLELIFGSKREFSASIAAYYMALSIFEFCHYVSEGGDTISALAGEQLSPKVSLSFSHLPAAEQEIGFDLLRNNMNQLSEIWRTRGISTDSVKTFWPHWVHISSGWIFRCLETKGISCSLPPHFRSLLPLL